MPSKKTQYENRSPDAASRAMAAIHVHRTAIGRNWRSNYSADSLISAAEFSDEVCRIVYMPGVTEDAESIYAAAQRFFEQELDDGSGQCHVREAISYFAFGFTCAA